jgi:7,8-dihydroneopterin aldolase/epimerase/oxygenase
MIPGPDGGASSGRIALRGMRFEGRHGVGADERAYPQVIEVDVELEVDLGRASRSDELGDTVDYGPLVELTRAVVEDRTFHLLEGIAGALLDAVMAEAPAATGAMVRVRKLAVPIDADLDHAEVTLRRGRGS